MSEIGRVIDRVAADALATRLARAGFQRSGRTWRLQVQTSRYNADAEDELSLELADQADGLRLWGRANEFDP